MHVGATHEDGDLHALTLDVGVLCHLLDGDDGTVGRGDELGGALGEDAPWNAEESCHHKAEDHQGGNEEIVQHRPVGDKEQHQEDEQEDGTCREEYDFLTFAMNFHILFFIIVSIGLFYKLAKILR